MSIKKQYLKSKPECKVTFRLRATESHKAANAHLVGDFNGWDTHALPMKRLKNGDFTQTLSLPVGQTFQFRYFLYGSTWENDWQADSYVPSPVSMEENSVISL